MQPIVVVAALIRRGSSYLVARRSADGPRSGLWEFPGGKVDAGEAPENALRREIREELALEIGVGEQIDRVRWDYPDVSIDLRAYECTIVGGVLVVREHQEVAWVDAGDLAGLAWSPADAPIARRIATRSGCDAP